MPKVSVIIPTYNYSKYIEKAIDSVLAQTYKDFEIIVVDDGSTDNTREIIETRYKDKVRYFYQENKGAPAARNKGIKESKGKYLVFLDSDDWLKIDNLKKKVTFLESHKQFKWIYSDSYFIDNDNGVKILASVKKKFTNLKNIDGNIFEELLTNTILTTNAVLLSNECLKEVGVFDETLPGLQDYDLWIRISKKFPIAYIDEPLSYTLIHKGSMSKGGKRIGYVSKKMVIQKIEKNYPLDLKRIGWRWKKIKSDMYNYSAYRHLDYKNYEKFLQSALRSVLCYPLQRTIYKTVFKNLGTLGVKKIIQIILFFLYTPFRIFYRVRFKIENDQKIILSATHIGIGNAILMVPLLETLKTNFPQNKIFIISNSQAVEEIYKRLSCVDKIVLIKLEKENELWSGIKSYIKKIRIVKPDIYVSHFLHNLMDFSLFGYFSGARYRVTYNDLLNGILDTFFLSNDRKKHEVERNLEFAKFCKVKQIIDDINIPIEKEELKFAHNFLNLKGEGTDRIILGIHPGCDKGSAHKRWPLDRFIAVARRLHKRNNLKIIFFIGPGETDLLPNLRRIQNSRIMIASMISLGQTMALISRCNLFLTNDSGLMHVAAAFNIPTIALFGHTSPFKNRPWKTPHTIIQYTENNEFSELDFADDLEAIRRISSDEVFETVNEYIETIETTKFQGKNLSL